VFLDGQSDFQSSGADYGGMSRDGEGSGLDSLRATINCSRRLDDELLWFLELIARGVRVPPGGGW
jgi:hypothetical protein